MRSVVVGLVVAFALVAAPAQAANLTVNCKELPAALKSAGSGDVITLDELCALGFPYKLPKVQVTLAGTPGAGFDGGATTQLEGGEAPATIEGLVFENAKTTAADAGAGLSVNTAGEPYAYTLARDTFANDAAEGAGGDGGARLNTSEGIVTVTGSTFTGDSTVNEGGGGGLFITADTANLAGDTFTSDTAAPDGVGGGLFAELRSAGATLTGSQFSDDAATDDGGGAAISTQAAGGVALTLAGDTFSHDAIADPSGSSKALAGYMGGGLEVDAIGMEPTTVVQSGDAFEGDSISFKAAPVSAFGAGESVNGAGLQSIADRFTGNTLQPPDATENASKEHVFGWGAGLSVIACGDLTTPPAGIPDVLSTLSDAVVATNTLAGGPSANGAGVYVGALACDGAYAILHVDDSTITANTITGASGPVAGIDGGPRDVLSLANTILYGDSGGAELGGFGSLASVSSSYSDLCAGSAPFAGAGNICGDPKLVAPASGDVHETFASPTLGAGSNALVPFGLVTDAYGGPRILGPLGCGSSPPPIVDIGAAELAYLADPCAPFFLAAAPVLSTLTQSAKTWREGTKLAQLSSTRKKKPPVGTTFTFKLSEPAAVTLTFTTSARGRRVGRRCVAQNRKNSHKHRCSRTITAGSMTVAGHAGVDELRFYGRISAHKRLAPGAYTVTLVAVADGKRSAPQKLHFTIVR